MSYPGLTRTEIQQIKDNPPKPRCGQCANCKHVEATKQIMLAHHKNEIAPRYRTSDVALWNRALTDHPCTA